MTRHHSLDRLGLEFPGPVSCYPFLVRPELESSGVMSCYPFLVRPELESSGVMAQAGGGAGEPITSDIGGLLPIALCGLTSL